MNASLDCKIEEAFRLLSTESKEIYLGKQIPELLEIPSSLEFVRDYVGKNIPVIIRGGTLQWPAVCKWNSTFLRTTIPDKLVTVAVTPNGYADGIAKKEDTEYFVLPEEREMTIKDFLDELNNRHHVHYIQQQNSNFSECFKELMKDIDYKSLKFAEEAFNKKPDAINFWMGDEKAVTSMHKDPYENLYCVISGYKDFTLIPPVDMWCVPRQKYPIGIYKTDNENKMYIEEVFDDAKQPKMIEWVSIDPLKPDYEKYPKYKNATVFEVRVNSGDILYLPNLWFHHVKQSHKCIAVNFWYDMEYDARYCYYQMMNKLCSNIGFM